MFITASGYGRIRQGAAGKLMVSRERPENRAHRPARLYRSIKQLRVSHSSESGQDVSDEAALLAAIRTELEEDTPRLAYADWLDENNRAARAEFIRVQIELARVRRVTSLRRIKLHMRESELLTGNVADWIGELRELFPVRGGTYFGAHYHGGWLDGSDVAFRINFVRGFVGFVRGSWEPWCMHGNAIVSRHPVQQVELTTVASPTALRKRLRRLKGGKKLEEQISDDYVKGRRYREHPDWHTYEGYARRLCEACWPGVTFSNA
jgi:uncharacterized protein (TIGR02996 family)